MKLDLRKKVKYKVVVPSNAYGGEHAEEDPCDISKDDPGLGKSFLSLQDFTHLIQI